MARLEMLACQKVTSIHALFFEKYLVLKAVTVIAGYFIRICYVDYLNIKDFFSIQLKGVTLKQ